MIQRATGILLRGALAALVVGAVFAGSAGASPGWRFEGKMLEGTETVLGGAEKSGMTVPGMTTTCDNFLYDIAISNSGGTGQGELEEVPLFNCYTDADACTVEGIEAQSLPWATHLTSVGGSSYIVIEGVHVGILYGGEECVLNGFLVEVEGTAGGRVDNETESAIFDPASFTATGTELTAFGEAIEWNGVFPTEAFEWHREDQLTVS